MFTHTKTFSLTIAILLVLTLLLVTPTVATSPLPLPVEEEWPQIPRPAGGFAAATAPVFFDDMEGDVGDWTTTGFWHQVTNPQTISVYHVGSSTPDDPPNDVNPDLVTLPDTDASGMAYLGSAYSGDQAFWYGVDDYGCFIDPAGTFDPATQSAKNGGASIASNSGNLVSPDIDLTGLTAATLHFWTWWEIEGVDANVYDMMYVEISTDGGSNFDTLGTLNPLNDVDNEHHESYSSGGSKTQPDWVPLTFDISSYAGNVVKLQFRFDTIDSQYNGFRGWMIDDVTVEPTGVPAPQISSVFPDCVEVANLGTTIVTIYGANFVNGASVTVDSTPAGGVSVVSSSKIQILLPATLTSGTYDVTVTNPGGQGATLSDAITVSSDPCPTEECPGMTILSVRSGNWGDQKTWNLNQVPGKNDVVLIRAGHTVVGPASARIQGLCNYGLLSSPSPSLSDIHAACEYCPMGKCRLGIKASGRVANYGQILGRDGNLGIGNKRGGQGCSIELWGSPVYNEGTIQAGNGGDGDKYGGRGGSVYIGGQDTTNSGTICAGDGGDVLGVGAGQAGHGGAAEIWGKRFKWVGTLTNNGLACGGDGGDGNPAATGPQRGGKGGPLCLVSLPNVFLNNGVHFAGWGGQGTGGGNNGRDGKVTIEPNTISLAGSGTRVSGGDVLIFGGNDWILDLSNLTSGAITATGNITIAVGSGGVVDLSGNTSQVLQAGGQVVIASDDISLDTGVDLADVVGANVTTGPSQIVYDFSLADPEPVTWQPGVTTPITLTLLNGGPMTDTYSLDVSDAAGWDLGDLPSPVTVGGIDMTDLTLSVTPPSDAEVGDTNAITVTATSQADPNLVEVAEVKVTVETKGTEVYLPLVLRNYSAGLLYFDDFSDPNSGWPVSDRSNYALDYNNGNYHIQLKRDDWAVWAWPGFACADCTIEVEAWRDTGANSRYGIVFGLNSSGSQFYLFRIQPGWQEYKLQRYDEGTWVTRIPYTYSSHINSYDSHNQLKVTREGSQIRLYANDHYLASYDDSTYSGTRSVGLYAGSGSTSPVWLRYDDFTVWEMGYGVTSATEGGSGSVGATDAPPD